MSGNVYEWCNDYWGYYSEEAQTDPTGPGYHPNNMVVIRGGCYSNSTPKIRTSFRTSEDDLDNWKWLGFRLVLVP